MEGPRLTKRRTDIDLSKAVTQEDTLKDQSSNFWVTDDTKMESYPSPHMGVSVQPSEIRYFQEGPTDL